MQSIDELARAITELDPSEQQALLAKVSSLNALKDRDGGAEAKLELVQEAMNDELFIADLREVMNDFRHIDAEETAA